MTQNEYGIDLKERLDYLLKDIINEYDIIAPIARKGIRVLELSTYADYLFDNQKVLYYSSIPFHAKELKNKKIVLFDESVRTGESLNKSKDNLILLSMKKKLGLKVQTAALLVSNQVKDYPRHYLNDLVCDRNLYDFLSDELLFKILSSGRPLDVDHPIITIKLQHEVIQDLLQHLNKISYSVELGHSGYFDDVRMFTVEFQDIFEIPEMEGYTQIFDEGPKKIRLFLKDDTLYCVPVVYPGLEVTETPFNMRKSCKLLESLKGNAFCNVLNLDNALVNLNDNSDKENFKLLSSLCYQCVVYELNCRLIGQFLEKLKRVIPFDFLRLEKRYLQALHHDEGKRLGEIIEKRIRSIMEGDGSFNLGRNRAKQCNLIQITPIKRNYLLSNIRPELEVSMAISRNTEINEGLFRHGEYSIKDPEIGLSYCQISEMMKEMGEHRFSEGMDIALDIGLLKPVNPLEGINVTCGQKTTRAIVRLYKTSSEDVEKSLKFFANLVTAEEDSELDGKSL